MIDFAKPIVYNDDVFGRLYNQQPAYYCETLNGIHRIMVDGQNKWCNDLGIEDGYEEPSVFNEEV